MRYELTEFEWTAIRPFLPNKPRGVPRVNDRRVLIFWILRSGAPWRDLPEGFGPYTTGYNRFGFPLAIARAVASSPPRQPGAAGAPKEPLWNNECSRTPPTGKTPCNARRGWSGPADAELRRFGTSSNLFRVRPSALLS